MVSCLGMFLGSPMESVQLLINLSLFLSLTHTHTHTAVSCTHFLCYLSLPFYLQSLNYSFPLPDFSSTYILPHSLSLSLSLTHTHTHFSTSTFPRCLWNEQLRCERVPHAPHVHASSDQKERDILSDTQNVEKLSKLNIKYCLQGSLLNNNCFQSVISSVFSPKLVYVRVSELWIRNSREKNEVKVLCHFPDCACSKKTKKLNF